MLCNLFDNNKGEEAAFFSHPYPAFAKKAGKKAGVIPPEDQSCEKVGSDYLLVRLKKTFPAHTQYPYYGFFDDIGGHFRNPFYPVDERNGYLLNGEPQLPGGKFHLNLKGIANEPDLPEVDRLQYFPAITNESGGGIFYRHPGERWLLLPAASGRKQ